MKSESITDCGHERKKFSPKKAVASVAAFAVFATAGIGCGKELTKSQPQPKPTKTEIASPSPEATPANVDMFTNAMEKYKRMDVETFDELPFDERLQYSQYAIDLTVLSGEYKVLYGQAKSREYKIKPEPVSIDSNGQEILDANLYNRQLAYINVGDGKSTGDWAVNYDTRDGEKIFNSVYYETRKGKMVSVDYLDNVAELEKMGKSEQDMFLKNKWTATGTSDLMSGKDRQGNTIQYKNVKFHNQDGKDFEGKFIYKTYENYDGNEQGVWLLDFFY